MISKMCSRISLFWLVFVLSACVATVPQSSQNFDQIWLGIGLIDAPSVGLVQLANQADNSKFNSPIVSNSATLKLDFDLLNSDFQYLSFKIFHCNADWSRSLLRDLEFLDTFNEFQIRDYHFSQTNYAQYTHYTAQLPRVSKSGNYILVVYDEDNNEMLFSRRFSVVEQRSEISTRIERPQNIALRNSHHQITYILDYGSLNVINPQTDIKSYLIQNQNWNVGFNNLSPTQVRIDQHQLTYENFSDENTVAAWNEFRFFDTRRISNRGLRVADQYQSSRGAEVFLETDLSNSGLAYSQVFQEDLDGWFFTSNRDLLETDFNSEYTYVHFELKSKEINGNVFVNGRFNDWSLDDKYKMTFDESSQSYKGEFLMKQGYYNYRYELISPDLPRHFFEGSHFQTENTYELMVYYREPGTVYDRLVGYQRF